MKIIKITIEDTLVLSLQKWVENNPTLRIIQVIRDEDTGDWILVATA